MNPKHDQRSQSVCSAPDHWLRFQALSSNRELDTILLPYAQGMAVTWTETEGCRMRWLVGGSGPALVLVHGDYGSWTHWIKNLTSLCSHYRLLVPDMPGYGASDLPPGDFSEGLLARLLQGALRKLIAYEDYRLVGFSFGGIVSGHLAALDAHRVSHLVVCGPGGLGVPNGDALPVLERAGPGTSETEEIAIQQRNLARLMIADPAKSDELAARVHIENIAGTRVRASGIPRTTTLLDVLPGITAQLGAIWGGRDRYGRGDAVTESERRLRQSHPGLAFRIIEAAGHWVPYEAPACFEAALHPMLVSTRETPYSSPAPRRPDGDGQ